MMIVLTQPPPSVVRQSQTVIIRGRAEAVHGARIALEGRTAYIRPTPGWKVLIAVKPHRSGRFVIRWKVPRRERTGPESLRVIAVRDGRVLAKTRPRRSFVGPAPVPCAPASPPASVPAGDGWITGGDYIEGGPYPGIDECASQAYTITATDSGTGQVVATQHVAGGHSYTLIVPAGSYQLKANSCGFGQATVTAGQPTHADVVCPVP